MNYENLKKKKPMPVEDDEMDEAVPDDEAAEGETPLKKLPAKAFKEHLDRSVEHHTETEAKAMPPRRKKMTAGQAAVALAVSGRGRK